MVLKKDDATVTLTNDIQIAAFLASGWEKTQKEEKNMQTTEKKGTRGGK